MVMVVGVAFFRTRDIEEQKMHIIIFDVDDLGKSKSR